MHLISLGPRKTTRISHFFDPIALSMCLVVATSHIYKPHDIGGYFQPLSRRDRARALRRQIICDVSSWIEHITTGPKPSSEPPPYRC